MKENEAIYGVWGPPSQQGKWNAENALSDVQKGIELATEQLAKRE